MLLPVRGAAAAIRGLLGRCHPIPSFLPLARSFLRAEAVCPPPAIPALPLAEILDQRQAGVLTGPGPNSPDHLRLQELEAEQGHYHPLHDAGPHGRKQTPLRAARLRSRAGLSPPSSFIPPDPEQSPGTRDLNPRVPRAPCINSFCVFSLAKVAPQDFSSY